RYRAGKSKVTEQGPPDQHVDASVEIGAVVIDTVVAPEDDDADRETDMDGERAVHGGGDETLGHRHDARRRPLEGAPEHRAGPPASALDLVRGPGAVARPAASRCCVCGRRCSGLFR